MLRTLFKIVLFNTPELDDWNLWHYLSEDLYHKLNYDDLRHRVAK